jgi:16S rRNA (adenine1518-N6/adenine1519-N6)-dimethyltransferase
VTGRPRKRFGQHFLTDPRILGRIAGALELAGDETVIEIGPGRGALTSHLAGRCRRLIAVEIDRDLAAQLSARYAGRTDVEIVTGDVLDRRLADVAGGGPYVVIGNVPYYVTTPILFHALERPRAGRAVFLVQREVADRMVASPNSAEYGALSVNVQALARVERLFGVPAGAFSPPPKVESAVVRLTPRLDAPVAAEHEEAFSTFVIQAFSQRRKQLGSVVRGIARIDTAAASACVTGAGLDPRARPENLTVADFVSLFRAVRAAAAANPSGPLRSDE